MRGKKEVKKNQKEETRKVVGKSKMRKVSRWEGRNKMRKSSHSLYMHCIIEAKMRQ